MVLSCSLRDFLSPLGMEIRLGLCKRIFYFSFFPLHCFFYVRCPEWPFRKSNLDFFFSLTTAFFFAICCNADVCPMDFNSGVFRKGPFFRLEEGENLGLQLPFGPGQQGIQLYNEDLSLNTGCFQWHWQWQWITINQRTYGFYGEAAVTSVQSVDLTIVWISISPLSKV